MADPLEQEAFEGCALFDAQEGDTFRWHGDLDATVLNVLSPGAVKVPGSAVHQQIPLAVEVTDMGRP